MARSKNVKSSHKGVEIVLDTDSWWFDVPEIDNDRSYETMVAARAAVDAFIAAKEAASRKKLDLTVITEDGETAHVTSVHAGNFNLNVKEKVHVSTHQPVYPDAPVVRYAMCKRKEHELELRRWQEVLKLYAVAQPNSLRSTRLRNGASDSHSALTDAFEAEVKRQAKFAAAADPDAVYKRIAAKVTTPYPHVRL